MKELIHINNIVADGGQNTSLRHVSLSIPAGEQFWLIGLHNSGKTSLCRLLRGRLPFQDGSLIINNKTYSSFTEEDARNEGIFYLDSKDYQLISNLSIAENLTIFHNNTRRIGVKLFHTQEAVSSAERLLSRFHLSINPNIKAFQLSRIDSLIIHILAMISAGAKLIVFNSVDINISYKDSEKMLKVLNQAVSEGISCMYVCDSLDETANHIGRYAILSNGMIVRESWKPRFDCSEVNNILRKLSGISETPQFENSHASAVGIMELEDYQHDLRSYIEGLPFYNELSLNARSHYLSHDSLLCFNENLRIGENLALIRYPSIAVRGVINPSSITYLESEFNETLKKCGSNAKFSMKELSHADRAILGIERWVQSGCRTLVIQSPSIGLDIKGRQILINYFRLLEERNVQCIILFYSFAGLRSLFRKVYICRNGIPIDTFR